ncbi:MAG: 4-alpha-glucanotransferase, partial [Bacteroidota bacterium]
MIQDQRRFGILLHPTSLPGPHGIGDLGPSAHHFVDVAAQMGVRLWQVLPLGPTAWGNSPYQSPSTFAGNPLLISLEALVDEGLLEQQQAPWELQADPHRVDYEAVRAYKEGRLREAYAAFEHAGGTHDPHFVSF